MADIHNIHILMPTYNGSSFLENSMGYVFGQTHEPITVIAYDDGSTDDTREIIHSYINQGHRVVLLEGAKNKGIAHARKRLLEASQEMDPDAAVMWLDQDDRLTSPHSVKMIVDQMNLAKADICLVGFGVEWENDSSELKANAAGLLIDKENHEKLLSEILQNPGQVVSLKECPNILKATSLGWTKIYSPKMLNLWPETDESYTFEDFPPMALLLEADRVTALSPDRPVINYLRRATSVTGDRKPEHFYDDFVGQMRSFLGAVDMTDPVKAEAAKGFVQSKSMQYEKTLSALIASGRTGFDEGVMKRYKSALVQLG